MTELPDQVTMGGLFERKPIMYTHIKHFFGLAIAVAFSTAGVATDRSAMPVSEIQPDSIRNGTLHTGHGRSSMIATQPSGPVYVELRIDACNPESICRLASLLFDPYHVSLMTCMIAGQREVAVWNLQNPTWTVKRWSCGFADNGLDA
jgi:hypothetical protein